MDRLKTREDLLQEIRAMLDEEGSRGLLALHGALSPEEVFAQIPVTVANLPRYGLKPIFRSMATIAALELVTRRWADACVDSEA
jgi:hypothetical protein